MNAQDITRRMEEYLELHINDTKPWKMYTGKEMSKILKEFIEFIIGDSPAHPASQPQDLPKSARIAEATDRITKQELSSQQECPCHCHCKCGGYHQKGRNVYVTPYTWDGCPHCQKPEEKCWGCEQSKWLTHPKSEHQKPEKVQEAVSITHINPNCFGSKYCEPHSERGEVYYKSEAVRTLLSSQRQELIEKVKKLYKPIRSLKIIGNKRYASLTDESYNQALDSVLAILKEGHE